MRETKAGEEEGFVFRRIKFAVCVAPGVQREEKRAGRGKTCEEWESSSKGFVAPGAGRV